LDLDKSNAIETHGLIAGCVGSRLEAHDDGDHDDNEEEEKKEENEAKEDEDRKAQDKRERASSPWRPWYAPIGVLRKGVASLRDE